MQNEKFIQFYPANNLVCCTIDSKITLIKTIHQFYKGDLYSLVPSKGPVGELWKVGKEVDVYSHRGFNFINNIINSIQENQGICLAEYCS